MAGVGIQHNADFQTVANWLNDTTLVLGGRVPSATGLLTQGDRAVIYTRLFGTDKALVLGANTTNDDNEIQIVAGATPALKFRASGDGLAFTAQPLRQSRP